MRHTLRSTPLVLTCLLALSLAPLAAAGGCSPYDARLEAPTGQHASLAATSCGSPSHEARHAGVHLEDETSGQYVYVSAYRYESTYYGNESEEYDYENEGVGAGAYNGQGNLVPTVFVQRSEGEWSSPYGSSEWSDGHVYVGWGPFYQNVRLPVLP